MKSEEPGNVEMKETEYNQTEGLARRDFLKGSPALIGAAAAVAAGLAGPPEAAAGFLGGRKSRSVVESGDVILFQGDSITDAGRSRDQDKEGKPNNQGGLGSGYAWLAAAALLTDRPKDGLRIFNRGISGNKVFQLADRWQKDCLDLQPAVLSVLIGVNDIWHRLNGNYDGTVEIYERDYRALIERTRKALPKVKLVVCEPFVLRCGAVNEKWFPQFDAYRAAARRVAEAHKAAWVPFQSMFDTAVQFAPPEHWAKDGVHPSPAGAALMAHTWVKVVDGV